MLAGNSHLLVRVRTALLCGTLLAALTPAAHSAEEDTGAKLFRETNGCVVALENLEGSGSGFIIDRTGLILTNAHVISSPLPYKCTVEVKHGNKLETVVFKKVKIVGVHPDKDLALVQIDLKEHAGVTLQLAKLTKDRPSPGQRIFAIGNPGGGGMVLNKTITSGMLSGVNRVIEKVAYYQVDAAINPGNSGGPLFNSSGEVIGIVTLKFTDVENTGFAIPLFDLDTNKFVSVKDRKADPQRAQDLLVQANKYFQRGKQLEAAQKNSEQAKMYFYFSARTYHEALSVDPTNDATYYNIGMLLRTLGRSDVASAYLMQAIEMNPWEKRNNQPGTGISYRELGLSLMNEHKMAEARTAWEEGLAKFPQKAARIWEDLAITLANANDPYGAAFNARVVLALNSSDSRPELMRKLLTEVEPKLNPVQRKKLQTETAKLGDLLKRRQAVADQQFQSRKEFVTQAFASYVKNEGQLGSNDGKTAKVVVSSQEPPGDDKPETTPKKASAEKPAKEAVTKIPLPAGAEDLLAHVSVRQDAFKGNWVEDENGVASPPLAYARLVFPSKVPEEYDLLLIAERQTNKGELVIGFPRGGKQSLLHIDAQRGQVSGLDPESRDAHQGQVMTNGTPVKIVMKVRREGLMVTVDGKQIVMERTTEAFPAVPAEWSVNDETHLFLGTNTSKYRIHQMAIKAYERQ